jgi:hypothetical protein
VQRQPDDDLLDPLPLAQFHQPGHCVWRIGEHLERLRQRSARIRQCQTDPLGAEVDGEVTHGGKE